MNFDTQDEIILENERVRLTPLRLEDKQHLLRFSLYEPDLWIYSLTPASGEANLDRYLEMALKKRAEGDSYPFIVYDKKQQAYAGSTRFYDIQRHHNTVQLGYTWYGKDFQGTGLNRNCKFLLLSFAFDTLGVNRVEFRADANNERSIAAMKSLGCTYEGILRSNCKSSTGRRDSIILSILKEEWITSIKANLESQL